MIFLINDELGRGYFNSKKNSTNEREEKQSRNRQQSNIFIYDYRQEHNQTSVVQGIHCKHTSIVRVICNFKSWFNQHRGTKLRDRILHIV